MALPMPGVPGPPQSSVWGLWPGWPLCPRVTPSLSPLLPCAHPTALVAEALGGCAPQPGPAG